MGGLSKEKGWNGGKFHNIVEILAEPCYTISQINPSTISVNEYDTQKKV